MTHQELAERAKRWLENDMGCGIAFVEITAAGCSEICDVIGFRSMYSILVECKTSREDFLADLRKPHREEPSQGVGNYRYYFCEPGIIEPDDLPDMWGLAYVNGRSVNQIVNAINTSGGNIAQEANRFDSDDLQYKERKLMYSGLRRLAN